MDDGYTLNIGMWNSVFAVPTELADSELRMASGAQLKVMLYMLRHGGEDIGIDRLAGAAGLSEGDAKDAVGYWISRGLITPSIGQLIPASRRVAERMSVPEAAEGQEKTAAGEIRTAADKPFAGNDPLLGSAPFIGSVPSGDTAVSVENITQPESVAADAAEDAQDEKKPKRREKMRYDYSEAIEMANEDPDLRQMLLVLEGLLCKQLNHSEVAVFITMVKWYGLPSACVAMLVEYCLSIGRSSLAYIEQTGIGWSKEEILTVEQADAKIRRLRAGRTAWNRVRTLLEIPERKPTDTELKMSEQWINEWHTADELVRLAYDRCVDKKGKLSFSYMNGILRRWKESGFETAEAVLADESREQNSRTTSANGERYAPTYDISEIEQQLDMEWFGDNDGD